MNKEHKTWFNNFKYKLIYAFILYFFNTFIYFWLCWVFIAAQVFSSGSAWAYCSYFSCWGTRALEQVGFDSLSMRAQQLLLPGSRVRTGSLAMVHGLSCTALCGSFQDQRLNPWLLHWQADSLLLSQEGSPLLVTLKCNLKNTVFPSIMTNHLSHNLSLSPRAAISLPSSWYIFISLLCTWHAVNIGHVPLDYEENARNLHTIPLDIPKE